MGLARPGDGLGFSHQALAGREEGVSRFRGLSLRGKPCCLSTGPQPRWWSVDPAVHSEGFCWLLGSLLSRKSNLISAKRGEMHLGLRNLKRFRGRVLIFWDEESLPEDTSPWKQREGPASPL